MYSSVSGSAMCVTFMILVAEVCAISWLGSKNLLRPDLLRRHDLSLRQMLGLAPQPLDAGPGSGPRGALQGAAARRGGDLRRSPLRTSGGALAASHFTIRSRDMSCHLWPMTK